MIPDKLIREDLYRYEGKWGWCHFLRYFLFTPGFRYTCIWRWTKAASKFTRPFWILLLRHYQIKYGFQIPWQTEIGRGFRINHFGTIVVNPLCKIGHNFNIAEGALLGYNPPSKNRPGSKSDKPGGAPVIGNNVCVQANAVVIGPVTIGDNCLIAPGAFVNKDMPPAIAVGNPATFHYAENASSLLIPANTIDYSKD